MSLDQDLLDILVCPNCRGDVEYREEEQLIVCLQCGYRYPVRDGIPVMLIEEAELPKAEIPDPAEESPSRLPSDPG